jgi:hypothetical protein
MPTAALLVLPPGVQHHAAMQLQHQSPVAAPDDVADVADDDGCSPPTPTPTRSQTPAA